MKTIVEAISVVNRPEKILQFGEGNFLRAFVDWMIDILNEKTDFNGSVVLVQPIERGMIEMINEQQGLYTTVLRGMQNGKIAEEFRSIRSISRGLDPYTQFDEYIKCAENPDLRFIISNTTEAGIAYNPSDTLNATPQKSYPAKVAAFLYHRFLHFKGDITKAMVLIPCELIDKNGNKLKEYVLRYADEWKLGNEFGAWITACDFCNSLVDRIVPGYPKDEASAICEKIGYEDKLLVAAEIFHLWVIETSHNYSKELPFDKAGLNVIWTDDMSFYRTRKVRILNGAHTSTVPTAFLYGLNTVEECIHDPLTCAFMKQAIFEEIIPSMDISANADVMELKQYANDVLERFANPYIKHLLLSITLNSVSKFKTRILPSLTSYIRKTGKPPAALSFSLSALIAFYEGGNFANEELIGKRAGENYSIKDDEHILKAFESLYAGGRDAEKIVRAVLKKTEWWDEDLNAYAGLESAVVYALADIWKDGIKKAMGDRLRI
jgi:tagaturonate reductase